MKPTFIGISTSEESLYLNTFFLKNKKDLQINDGEDVRIEL